VLAVPVNHYALLAADPGAAGCNGSLDTPLIIGSGGREHALAWKLKQSPKVGKIFILIFSILLASNLAFAEELSMSDADKALYNPDENPGDIYIAKGEELFLKLSSAKALSAWLGVSEKALPKEIATFPKYMPKLEQVVSIEKMLQGFFIDTKNQKIALTDSNMTILTAYVKSLANGEKIALSLNEPNLKKAIAEGEKVYKTKRGLRGLACYSCHSPSTIGTRLRMQMLPDLKANDVKSGATWPAYRMTKTEMTTMQKRFQGCMENASQEKLPIGSTQMVDLEAYVTSLSQGQTIAIPGLKR
jgi:sulfur-oxidizing protein SoxA